MKIQYCFIYDSYNEEFINDFIEKFDISSISVYSSNMRGHKYLFCFQKEYEDRVDAIWEEGEFYSHISSYMALVNPIGRRCLSNSSLFLHNNDDFIIVRKQAVIGNIVIEIETAVLFGIYEYIYHKKIIKNIKWMKS